MSPISRQRLPFLALTGVLLVGLAILVWAGGSGHQSLAARTKQVATQLRCPVCHGESVYDSPSALAGNMRSIIRAKLASGWSEAAVTQFFVRRYGQWILLAPPFDGVASLLWLGPPLLVAAGLILLAVTAVAWRAHGSISPRTDIFGPEDAISAAELDAEQADLSSRAVPVVEAHPVRKEAQARGRQPGVPATGTGTSPAPRMLGLQLIALLALALALSSVVALAFPATESTTSPTKPTASALAAALLLVRDHPKSAGDWSILAQIQFSVGRSKDALHSYHMAIRLAPKDPGPRLGAAYILTGQSRPQAALDLLAPIKSAARKIPQFWLVRGIAYRRLGDRQPAVTAFRHFLALSPPNPVDRTVRHWIRSLQHSRHG